MGCNCGRTYKPPASRTNGAALKPAAPSPTSSPDEANQGVATTKRPKKHIGARPSSV